jgi:hypothetical protein
VSFLVLETSRACSVAIDFGKLFSSSFEFLSFHTARVKFPKWSKTVLTAPKRHFPSTPNNGHHQADPVGPVRADTVEKVSFLADERNVSGPLMRSARGDVQQACAAIRLPRSRRLAGSAAR